MKCFSLFLRKTLLDFQLNAEKKFALHFNANQVQLFFEETLQPGFIVILFRERNVQFFLMLSLLNEPSQGLLEACMAYVNEFLLIGVIGDTNDLPWNSEAQNGKPNVP